MKTAYELAMERLSREAPSPKLTAEQKNSLAELDSRYKAKLAEREIFLREKMDKVRAEGDYEAYQQLEKQWVSEQKVMRAELEEKKERIRAGS